MPKQNRRIGKLSKNDEDLIRLLISRIDELLDKIDKGSVPFVGDQEPIEYPYITDPLRPSRTDKPIRWISTDHTSTTKD